MKIQDVNIIRELAARLREISQEPQYEVKRRRWMLHDALAGDKQPLLWICPDEDANGGWAELVPLNSLQTEDPDLHPLECQLRRLIYHHDHFDDDFVIEPLVRFEMPGEYTGYTFADSTQRTAWGIPIQGQGVSKHSYHLQNYLDDEENVEKLLAHEVDFLPDEARIQTLRTKYEEAVDGQIRVDFVLPYVVLVQSLLIELVHLRGLEELMYDLYESPEWLLRIMDHMSDSKTRLLDRLERENRLFDNRTNIYTGSGGLGYLPDPPQDPGHIRLSDMWGFADAQEFTSVSPKMFEEFALPYQAQGLKKFGMACYGCCEPLDQKYDMIFKHLPNIRRLSVSPWANIDLAAEQIQDRAIYSWKPSPSLVTMTFDEDTLRGQLRHLRQATGGKCFTEVILKDIRTCGAPGSLERYAKLFREEMG